MKLKIIYLSIMFFLMSFCCLDLHCDENSGEVVVSGFRSGVSKYGTFFTEEVINDYQKEFEIHRKLDKYSEMISRVFLSSYEKISDHVSCVSFEDVKNEVSNALEGVVSFAKQENINFNFIAVELLKALMNNNWRYGGWMNCAYNSNNRNFNNGFSKTINFNDYFFEGKIFDANLELKEQDGVKLFNYFVKQIAVSLNRAQYERVDQADAEDTEWIDFGCDGKYIENFFKPLEVAPVPSLYAKIIFLKHYEFLENREEILYKGYFQLGNFFLHNLINFSEDVNWSNVEPSLIWEKALTYYERAGGYQAEMSSYKFIEEVKAFARHTLSEKVQKIENLEEDDDSDSSELERLQKVVSVLFTNTASIHDEL